MQADSCGRDLTDGKSYLQRYSVCEMHFKADNVLLNGRPVRFCQVCMAPDSAVSLMKKLMMGVLVLFLFPLVLSPPCIPTLPISQTRPAVYMTAGHNAIY